MNERIKELMNEAVRFHWDHDGQAYEAQVHPEDLEYFAELIVRECIKEIEEFTIMSEDYVQWNQALSHVALYLKDHFGIEE